MPVSIWISLHRDADQGMKLYNYIVLQSFDVIVEIGFVSSCNCNFRSNAILSTFLY